MKRLGFLGAICSVVLLAVCLVPGISSAIENDNPGSFYYAESGSETTVDGAITSGDLTNLQSYISGVGGVYSGCRPPSAHIQDLDTDTVLGSGDVTILKSFISELWGSNQGSRPQEIFVLDGTTGVSSGEISITVSDSSSTSLSAYAIDDPSVYNGMENRRPGWGVVFEIDPAGSCTTANLYGHTAWGSNGVYQQTWDYESDALSTIKLDAGGCADGSTIILNVRIPSDGEAGNAGGRFPNELLWSGTVVGSVSAGAAVTCDSISIDQADPTDMTEGTNQKFTATCTMSDATTTDCTSDATWSVSGDLTNDGNSVDANEIPCGDGGSGTVTAEWTECSTTSSDSISVNVINDDTSEGVSSDLTEITEGDTDTYTLTRTWSDGCTEDVTSSSSVSGDCTGGSGDITALEENCDTSDGLCVISESDETYDVTRTDDGDTVVGYDSCSLTEIEEGTSDTYTCAYEWNEGTCTTDATADTSVSGDCTGGTGDITATEDDCDTSDGSCSID
ncbi:MAG: hypothetical protein R6V10_10810, partial [bacterium]